MTDAVATLPTATDGFLLQRVQPALSGLIDGSLSSLAPIFAVVLATTPSSHVSARGRATSGGVAEIVALDPTTGARFGLTMAS
jgi:hypothetical protein